MSLLLLMALAYLSDINHIQTYICYTFSLSPTFIFFLIIIIIIISYLMINISNQQNKSILCKAKTYSLFDGRQFELFVLYI